ncbi:hypothetical protein [Natronobacterium texcoconense]|uniref:DUF1102 domain-containing protein n=1 Tax=Natronobacterium texcoconense TaxID=1095778 RepID=A0A1H1IMA0_NATTX|nr:hypothetical protein [Natronobacterium texcoconense]SDR38827.1 hypothetical protein SAMN04489842_3626 [Natronobacterium texcoconense]
MQRRKFVIGLGALASGTAAAVGTGAFTSVEADRDASIEVTSDSSAYLQISAADTDNGDEYAGEADDGTFEITIDELNPEAETVIDDVFVVENQGSQSVGVQADVQGDNADAVTLDPDLEDGWETLGVGESTTVGLTIDTSGLSDGDEVADTIAFEADASEA